MVLQGRVSPSMKKTRCTTLVKFRSSKPNVIILSDCTCPACKGKCKHCIALLYALVDHLCLVPNLFLKAWLAHHSHDSGVELLLNQLLLIMLLIFQADRIKVPKFTTYSSETTRNQKRSATRTSCFLESYCM